MNIYGDDPDPPPSTQLLRKTLRKFKRLHKGGKLDYETVHVNADKVRQDRLGSKQ